MMDYKTKTVLLTFSILSFTLTVLFLPVMTAVFGANNTLEYFNVSVVITNAVPTILNVSPISAGPSEATTTTISVLFTVNDANGFADVDPTLSTANATLNGVTRTSTSCQDYSSWSTGNNRGVNCTINMQYYDESGIWNISVTAQDNAGANASSNDAENLTYGTLAAFQLAQTTISFTSGAPGTNNVNASNDPQTLNNTGNANFATINITGGELSNGAGDFIGPGNFTINATADAKGQSLTATPITISGVTLNRNTTANLYIWVDIPSGIGNGTYSTNTSTQWTIEAYS